MRYLLEKRLSETVELSNDYTISPLDDEGESLDAKLLDYLGRFIEGSEDPNLRNGSPSIFIRNLRSGRLGDFQRRYIITAKADDNVVGILLGMHEGNNRFHIYSLHVCPTYRRKGVASTLLKRCINDMTRGGIEHLAIDVHEDNLPAYHLYQKYGFTKVSES